MRTNVCAHLPLPTANSALDRFTNSWWMRRNRFPRLQVRLEEQSTTTSAIFCMATDPRPCTMKANLLKKCVVQEASCEVCGAAEETSTHIIFKCPFAQDFWQTLQFELPESINTTTLDSDEMPCPAHVPHTQFETLVLLCCWRLWKRRNGVVFGGGGAPVEETV
jgi:hypothetical protein